MPELISKFFLKNNFSPVVYVQNDQRVMGIILRYLCWFTHRPPWGARRLTGRPTYPPSAPPPLPSRPPKVFAPGWGLEFEQAAPLAYPPPSLLMSTFEMTNVHNPTLNHASMSQQESIQMPQITSWCQYHAKKHMT